MNESEKRRRAPSKEINLSSKDVARFLAKVTKRGPDDCWLWIGGVIPGGYGSFSIGKRTVTSHRVTWTMAHGQIPIGLFVCHRCDVQACCNPSHLFLGTPADNMADKVAKGRQAHGPAMLINKQTAFGSKVGGAKLTDDKVRDIRAKRLAGYTLMKLAIEYGVKNNTIHHITSGRTWRHLL